MRFARPVSLVVVALACVGLGGCPDKPADPSANGARVDPAKMPDLKSTTPKPEPGKVVADGARAESNPLCVGRVGSDGEEVLEIGGKKYNRKGSTVSLDGQDGDDEFVLGQITDIKDHTPENAANLKLVIEWLKAEKVDAVAVTGDLGESAESIQRVVEDVAVLGVPVLAIIGNRECRDHFDQGI